MSTVTSEWLKSNLDYLGMRAQNFITVDQDLEKVINNEMLKVVELQNSLRVAESSLSVCKQAIDIVYLKSVKEIQALSNQAMSYIMPDYPKSLRISIDEMRNKTIEFELVEKGQEDNPDAETEEVKHGCGKGVRTIISFVLHAIYLIKTRSYPAIILDEGYSSLSTEYLQRFFECVKTFCAEKNLSLIIVTHDPRLISYADGSYYISDGKLYDHAQELPSMPQVEVELEETYRAGV